MKKSLKNFAMKCKISELECFWFFLNNLYTPVFMDRTCQQCLKSAQAEHKPAFNSVISDRWAASDTISLNNPRNKVIESDNRNFLLGMLSVCDTDFSFFLS